jgi:hypothetical protein
MLPSCNKKIKATTKGFSEREEKKKKSLKLNNELGTSKV